MTQHITQLIMGMQDQGDEMQDQRGRRTRGTGQEDAEGASPIPPHPRHSLLSSFLPSARSLCAHTRTRTTHAPCPLPAPVHLTPQRISPTTHRSLVPSSYTVPRVGPD